MTHEPSEPLRVRGDPIRLAQIVTNLLNNAAKFTKRDGRIELVLERDGDHAVVRVRDTGIGIDPAVLPHVFDRSRRIDEPRADASLGIGLSLVKRLAALHGGCVGAHSEGPGRGSEFVVRLPLVTSASSDSAVPAAAPAPSETRGKVPRRILVVDDNQDAAKTLSLLLEHSGHVVRSAFAGGAALEVAREFEPDVVLLDIGLPDMDGWELARTLRREGKGAGLTLIAISGYGQKEDRRRSKDAGIDHHLTKPVDYAEIRKCL